MTRHEITSRGMGWRFVFNTEVMVPFVNTLTTRYLLEHPTQWSSQWLCAICVMFSVGFLIYRGSNLQRFSFRKNPDHPSLAGLWSLYQQSKYQ